MYVLFFVIVLIADAHKECTKSITTASGTAAPRKICSGELLFEDNFDFLDFKKWQHERTLAGGGNWEFQWYDNSRVNSFTKDGLLYLKPSLTSDEIGEAALFSATIDLNGGAPADLCTNAAFYGCIRTGNSNNMINPIKSARIRTVTSFSFKYGRLEIRAKMPTGDWLWPAIWMLPRHNAFGGWPASGEIDITESRGNKDLVLKGENIGAQLMGSTLHWGPNSKSNAYKRTHWEKRDRAGYNADFHRYELMWTPDYINISLDGEMVGEVTPPEGGFWELGGFQNTSLPNPWIREPKMAPFNQEFYIVLNNAVGGVAYFPDEASNSVPKPWNNRSPKAARDFWDGRDGWLNTWNLTGSDNAALQVDYVRVYAL